MNKPADKGVIAPSKTSLGKRLERIDWTRAEFEIDTRGYALLPDLIGARDTSNLKKMFTDDRRFRRRINMENHGFGIGHYAYFANPLPELVGKLRQNLYRHLAPIANRMMAALGRTTRYPASLIDLQEACRAAGQTRPTPLLLHYREGGYNRLHRDLYGDLAFPLQVTVNLSEAGRDYEGGEFMLVENLPRRQSRGEAIPLRFCEAIVFPVSDRPVPGRRGILRAQMRHGVSRIRSGERFALGIIFHESA